MNRKPGDWNCRSCQHLNFSRRDMCQQCGETRTGGDFGAYFGGGRGMSSFGGGFRGSDVRPGDWYCNCGAHNFASCSNCFKCGIFKEESAIEGGFDGNMPRSRGFGFGNVGGGGRPGWKSDDWICTRSGCNEHNFASRMECFRCNAPRESGTYYAPRESGELRQNQIQIFIRRTSGETTMTESNPNISTDLSEKDSFNEPLTVSASKSSIFSDTSEETIEQKYLTTEIQTRSTGKLEANGSEKTEILSHENINLNSNSNLTKNSSKEEHVESITNKEEPDTEPFGGSFHEIPLIGRQSISSLKRIEIEDYDLLHALADGLIPYVPCNAHCGAHDLSVLPYSTGHTMHEANAFGRDADLLSEKEKSISVVSINDEGGLTDHMVDKTTIFGRSAETMEVSNFLLSEREKSFSVISIVGKGGLGKTTIAQLVYKDLRASRCFDLFGWVCVSEGFDFKRLIKVTIESISKINYGGSELSLLEVELAEIVKEKTILLVLDDVCNENQSFWELFQDPFIGVKMVRILVTTRNEKVVMQTTTCYRPTNLPEYSCWQLFQHHALSSTSETLPTHLVDMGREIMRKCDGLPLAVKIIASLLRHETDEKVWREILESDLWESNPTNNIFPALQISYDHLPAHLKLCFLVCSMYPKNYLLKKMNLIDIWISHGYIESRDKRRTTEIGVEYYKELKERSFIDGFSNCVPEWWYMQPMYALDESSGQFFEFCKLHDIIHDLARYNSKKEHYSMEINQPLDIQKEYFLPEVHHLYEKYLLNEEGFMLPLPPLPTHTHNLSLIL